MVSGLTSSEIAGELGISRATLNRHVKILRKAIENKTHSIQPSSVRDASDQLKADAAEGIIRPPVATIVTLDLVDPALLKTLQAHPQLLKILDSRVFEKVLAEILARLGYEIELQRGTKDGGVDIFAVKHCNVLGPHRYILQAKRWESNVGVEPVRELLFLHSHYKVTKSCLATTSKFTRGAWQLAHDYRWHLELKDYEALQEWVSLAIKGNDRNLRVYNPTAAPDANRALRGRRR